jgi:hypothetical protein
MLRFKALFENQITGKRTWFYISVGQAQKPEWGARITKWLQFTDLCDKNSEEIYVDDIVRAKIYNGIVNREKVYDYETFVVKAISNNRPYAFKLVDKEGNEWSFDNTTELEIVGNKWDNPELEVGEC